MTLAGKMINQPTRHFDTVLAQLHSEVEQLAQQIETVAEQRWQRQYTNLRDELDFQAQRINALSTELEQELLKIIHLLPTVEQTYASWQRLLNPQSGQKIEPEEQSSNFKKIVKAESLTLPTVVVQETAVILETKTIDPSSPIEQVALQPSSTKIMAQKEREVPLLSRSSAVNAIPSTNKPEQTVPQRVKAF